MSEFVSPELMHGETMTTTVDKQLQKIEAMAAEKRAQRIEELLLNCAGCEVEYCADTDDEDYLCVNFIAREALSIVEGVQPFEQAEEEIFA